MVVKCLDGCSMICVQRWSAVSLWSRRYRRSLQLLVDRPSLKTASLGCREQDRSYLQNISGYHHPTLRSTDVSRRSVLSRVGRASMATHTRIYTDHSCLNLNPTFNCNCDLVVGPAKNERGSFRCCTLCMESAADCIQPLFFLKVFVQVPAIRMAETISPALCSKSWE